MQLPEFRRPFEQLRSDLIHEMGLRQDQGLDFDVDLTEISMRFQEAWDACLAIPHALELIHDLESTLKKSDTDRKNYKSPYYNFILAYAYHRIGDTERATMYADLAATHFRTQDKNLQEAISHWLAGLLFCELVQLDKANEKKQTAIHIISEVNKKNRLFGSYVRYDSIRIAIEESFKNVAEIATEWKSILRDGFHSIPIEKFSTIISWLSIPNNEAPLIDLRKRLCPLRAYEPESLSPIIDSLGSRLQSKSDGDSKDPFANILLAHCHNIRYLSKPPKIQGVELSGCRVAAMGYTEYAIADFQTLNDTYNQVISHWYLSALTYNNRNFGAFRLSVETGNLLLATLVERYQQSSPSNIVQAIASIKKRFFDLLPEANQKNKKGNHDI